MADDPFAAELAARKAPAAAPAVAAANPFAAELASRKAAPAAAPQSTLSDVAESGGSGIVRGLSDLAQTPVTLARTAKAGANWLFDKAEDLGRKVVGAAPVSPTEREAQAKLRADTDFGGKAQDTARAALDSVLHTPTTTAGKFANSVGEALPGAAIMPAKGAAEVAMNALRFGVPAGVGAEAAGEAAKGTKYEGIARAAGGAIGGGIGSTALGGVSRVVSPIDTAAARLPLIKVMEREGIPLTAGQQTGNKSLSTLESVMSEIPGAGGGAHKIAEKQSEAFTQAALKRAGVTPAPGQLADADTMRKAATDIGNRYDDLSARNIMANDPKLQADIAGVDSTYQGAAIPAQQRPIIGKTVEDLKNMGFGMPGDKYQNTRSALSKQAESLRFADPPAAEASRGMKTALDSAMRRSISPEDAKSWDDTNAQYGVLKTLEKALGGAGEQTAEGRLSPQALRASVASSKGGKQAYVRGNNDLAELARAAAGTMPAMRNSGTAARENAMRIAHGANLLGAGAGALGHIPLALATAAAPAAAGRALMSAPVQAWLKNRLAAGLRPETSGAQRIAGAANGAIAPGGLADLFAPQRKAQ